MDRRALSLARPRPATAQAGHEPLDAQQAVPGALARMSGRHLQPGSVGLRPPNRPDGFAGRRHGPVTKGWIAASDRRLNDARWTGTLSPDAGRCRLPEIEPCSTRSRSQRVHSIRGLADHRNLADTRQRLRLGPTRTSGVMTAASWPRAGELPSSRNMGGRRRFCE